MLGGSFAHSNFKFLTSLDQRLLQLPLFVDVCVGSEPADDVALAIADWSDAGQEPAENAVSTTQGKFHLKSPSRRQRRFPLFQYGGQNFRVMHRLPAPPFHLFRCSARVLVPSCVVPEDVTVAACHPA